MKNWPEAEADFQHALEIVPDQPLVLNYLGYSWVDRGIHLDEAFKMLRRAVALRPEDGYIVDSLGWAHFRLGEYDEAVKELERAVTLKPSDPTINDHLGDAYWRTGRKLEAQFQWNHARDLNPDPDDLPGIVKKIANGLPDEAKPASAEAAEPIPPASPEPVVVTPAGLAARRARAADAPPAPDGRACNARRRPNGDEPAAQPPSDAAPATRR